MLHEIYGFALVIKKHLANIMLQVVKIPYNDTLKIFKKFHLSIHHSFFKNYLNKVYNYQKKIRA